MLLKKVSVKGIGELRHLGWRVFHTWPESRLPLGLGDKFFLRSAETCNFLGSRGLRGISEAGLLWQGELQRFLVLHWAGSNAVSRLPKAIENKTVKKYFQILQNFS